MSSTEKRGGPSLGMFRRDTAVRTALLVPDLFQSRQFVQIAKPEQ